MIASAGELHGMDFGAHMHLMEEWNESETWDWGPAYVLHEHPISTVVHQFSSKSELPSDPRNAGVMVAQYKTAGEGDIVGLYVFDRMNPPKGESAFNYVKGPKG